ncbi:hypothetical protein RB195_019474 [Necator americanus]|uniref:Uncharacterized protein n=1 Tax=Necator americanus TaxID=51031 RepID=A0ABR1CGE1_NECAM
MEALLWPSTMLDHREGSCAFQRAQVLAGYSLNFTTMLLLLPSALTLLLASEDLVCHPFLSEFSTLHSRTTADLQYIELAATKSAEALCKL